MTSAMSVGPCACGPKPAGPISPPQAPGRTPREKNPTPAFVEVVIAALLFQLGEDPRGVFVGPVREHHHIITIVAVGLGCCGRDDDRCVHARLLLQIPMAVIPIGAALPDREPIREALAGRDAREAQSGHAVHGCWQDHPMPMEGSRDVEAIVHADRDVLALVPPQHRAGTEPLICGTNFSRPVTFIGFSSITNSYSPASAPPLGVDAAKTEDKIAEHRRFDGFMMASYPPAQRRVVVSKSPDNAAHIPRVPTPAYPEPRDPGIPCQNDGASVSFGSTEHHGFMTSRPDRWTRPSAEARGAPETGAIPALAARSSSVAGRLLVGARWSECDSIP